MLALKLGALIVFFFWVSWFVYWSTLTVGTNFRKFKYD